MGIVIGTAGWTIPAFERELFPEAGSSLQRYASLFSGAEINSSFHRPHRRSTWERWADQVPDDFSFSVKVPKAITHKQKLVDCSGILETFLDEASGLGEKLAILLVQLPPSLAFEQEVAEGFFALLDGSSAAEIAANRATRAGSSRRLPSCYTASTLRASPPIRRACRTPLFRAGGAASATFAYTARPCPTGRAMRTSGWKAMRRKSARPPDMARCGASSIILPHPQPQGMPWLWRICLDEGDRRTLHSPSPSLNSASHHSFSEQDVPSRSAFNAWIGWGLIGR